MAIRIRFGKANQKILKNLKRTARLILRKSNLARSSSLCVNPDQLRSVIENELRERVTYFGNLSNGTDHATNLVTTTNSRYVLKIPKTASDLGLSFRQKFAFRALQGKLPIPTIRLATEKYVLEDYIYGINLDRASLDKAEEKKVFTQLGRFLNTIHQTKTEGFGVIGLDGKGQFSTLSNYARDLMDTWLPRLAKLSLLSPPEYDHLIEYLKRYDSNLDSVQTVMLHNDYDDYNIRVKNGTISGVLDFADLSSGPAAIDFARPFITYYGKQRFAYMLEGYGHADLKEIEYHAVLHLIRIIPYHARLKQDRKVAHRLKILRKVIH